jgi:hypothetical protein
MLGPDGGGLDIVLRTVLPWLLELQAAVGAAAIHPAVAAASPAPARRPTDSLASS